SLVRQRYWRKGGLLFDLLASIPFELIAIFAQNEDSAIKWQLVSLLRLNKLLRIVHLPTLAATLRRCCYRFHWSQSSMVFLKFDLSFVLPFCIAAHWMASVWFFMAYNLMTDSEEISWLVAAGYINGTTQEPITDGGEIHLRLTDDIPFTSFNLYVASLYFATSSLTSQSFGDIVSTNIPETCLAIGIIVFSIIFYSLLTIAISDLMEEQLKKRSQFEQRMVNISTFFTYRRLPFQFFIQTSRFFRTLWQRQQGLTEIEFLNMLSPKVKEDIALYVKQSMVMSLSFLTMAHEVFIRSLVTVLETEQFVYADIIYQVGDVTRVLYFINTGSTTILASKKTPLEKFKGALFGGRSLFLDEGREYTAIANCDCECFLLYFNDFEILMDRFPEYFEKCNDEWMHTERELDDEEEKPDQPSFRIRLARRESNGINRSDRRGSATSHSSAAFSMMGD
ncbi:Voltage-gated Ion Channel (VIC) Superfamily, partial [Thraustotheca clavata]